LFLSVNSPVEVVVMNNLFLGHRALLKGILRSLKENEKLLSASREDRTVCIPQRKKRNKNTEAGTENRTESEILEKCLKDMKNKYNLDQNLQFSIRQISSEYDNEGTSYERIFGKIICPACKKHVSIYKDYHKKRWIISNFHSHWQIHTRSQEKKKKHLGKLTPLEAFCGIDPKVNKQILNETENETENKTSNKSNSDNNSEDSDGR
jgi:protein-arginine kinase activator protein McsA